MLMMCIFMVFNCLICYALLTNILFVFEQDDQEGVCTVDDNFIDDTCFDLVEGLLLRFFVI
jgi:hypothetical protein